MNDAKPPVDQSAPASAPPPAPVKTVSTSQNLLIWFLVIVVGVLFGVAPGMMYDILGQGENRELAGTDYTTGDQRRWYRIYDEFMQVDPAALGWQRIPAGAVVGRLALATAAERRGLMPRGEALVDQMRQFLAKPALLSPDKRSRHAILKERDSISGPDLKWFLQIHFAIENLSLQRAPVPLTPATVANGIAAMRQSLKVTEVTLSTTALAGAERTAVAEDEEAILQAYDELREQWFVRPARRTLDLYWADPRAIAAKVVLADNAVADYYQANKEMYRLPDLPPPPAAEPAPNAQSDTAETPEAAAPSEPPPPPAPRYQPLAEVAEQIEQQLRQEQAQVLATSLAQQFSQSLSAVFTNEGKKPGDLGPERFAAIVAAAVIDDPEQVTEPITLSHLDDISIDQPPLPDDSRETAPLPTVAGLGSVRLGDEAFDRDVLAGEYLQGFVADHNQQVFVKLGNYSDPAALELEEVREELIDHVAARRAWPKLLAAAETIITQTGGTPGQLKSFFTDRGDDDIWRTLPRSKTYTAMTGFSVPPSDVTAFPEDEFNIIELATTGYPVAIATVAPVSSSNLAAAAPAIRLLQVEELPAASEITVEERQRQMRLYQSMVERHLNHLQFEELQREQFDNES